MNYTSILLLLITITSTWIAFFLYPHKHNGRSLIVNSYGALIFTLCLNILLPATLSITIKQGFLYWAQPYSHSTYINDALIVTLLSIVSFVIGFLATQSSLLDPRRQLRHKSTSASLLSDHVSREATYVLWAIVLFGFILKLVALGQIGIGPELIARMSGSIRREMALTGHEVGLTNYLVLLSTASEAAAALLFTISLKNRRHLTLIVFVALSCMAMTFILSGKRSTIILPLVLMVCSYTSLRSPLTTRSIPIVFFGIISFGMITLLFRILAPQSAVGNILDYRTLGEGSLVNFYLYSMEFAGFDMLVRSIAQSDQIIEILGGRADAIYRAFLEPFLYVVPRAIWADKPDQFVDIAHGFYAAVVGGGLTGTVGLSATLIGYCHLLGGPFAVAIAFICLGIISGLMDQFKGNRIHEILIRTFGIVIIFTVFRQGSLGWVFLIFIQNMSPAILAWLLFLVANKRINIRETSKWRTR